MGPPAIHQRNPSVTLEASLALSPDLLLDRAFQSADLPSLRGQPGISGFHHFFIPVVINIDIKKTLVVWDGRKAKVRYQNAVVESACHKTAEDVGHPSVDQTYSEN